MSPEQARGEAVDDRSDLFSLGSVLYAICTGRPPFRAETTYGVLRRITDDEPTADPRDQPRHSRSGCARSSSRLMSKRAADRFASAARGRELLEDAWLMCSSPPRARCRLTFPAERVRAVRPSFLPITGVLP